jgi:hypothetical protein
MQPGRSPEYPVAAFDPASALREFVMPSPMTRTSLIAAAVAVLGSCATTQLPQLNPKEMTFFVTSVGPGQGGNLGGLEGADGHCAALAKAAGGPDRTWRAYLSTQAPGLRDPNFVNARDRIGTGPWQNVHGVVIAANVDELHSPASRLTKQTALTEKGEVVNGTVDKPNRHDILTGSRTDGTAFPGPPFPDMTCGNWTKGGADGSAMVGHHDKAGPMMTSTWATSWNSSHPTIGCNMEKIRATGGDGLLYCFAAK